MISNFDDDLCEDCRKMKCRKCGKPIPNWTRGTTWQTSTINATCC